MLIMQLMLLSRYGPYPTNHPIPSFELYYICFIAASMSSQYATCCHAGQALIDVRIYICTRTAVGHGRWTHTCSSLHCNLLAFTDHQLTFCPLRPSCALWLTQCHSFSLRMVNSWLCEACNMLHGRVVPVMCILTFWTNACIWPR